MGKTSILHMVRFESAEGNLLIQDLLDKLSTVFFPSVIRQINFVVLLERFSSKVIR